MIQPSIRRPPRRRIRWGGLAVRKHKGRIDELRRFLPEFVTQPFGIHNGKTLCVNPRLLTVARVPMNDQQDQIPVGVVSTSYQLVQHRTVLDIASNALKEASIDPSQIDASILLTENGERMVLNLLFPDEDAYSLSLNGNGDKMRLRLQCFNSVDGSMRFMAFLGWFRFICSNGLVIGIAKVDIRKLHRIGLEVDKIGLLLTESLAAVEEEKQLYEQWRETAIERERATIWADGALRKSWGVKMAARALHIAQTGFDGKFEMLFEKGRPSEKSMLATVPVPGISAPCENAFQYSQILSWLAKERNEIQEQLERMREIPELMKALLPKSFRRKSKQSVEQKSLFE